MAFICIVVKILVDIPLRFVCFLDAFVKIKKLYVSEKNKLLLQFVGTERQIALNIVKKMWPCCRLQKQVICFYRFICFVFLQLLFALWLFDLLNKLHCQLLSVICYLTISFERWKLVTNQTSETAFHCRKKKFPKFSPRVNYLQWIIRCVCVFFSFLLISRSLVLKWPLIFLDLDAPTLLNTNKTTSFVWPNQFT